MLNENRSTAARRQGRDVDAAAGNVMVEAALVFPLLALLLFGLIQFGFLLSASITLRNAAAVGARVSMLTAGAGDACASARAAASAMLAPDSVQCTPRTTGGSPPMYSISLVYDYPLIAGWTALGLGSGTFQLRASATMQ